MNTQMVIEPVWSFAYVQRSEEVARKSVFVHPAAFKPVTGLEGGRHFPIEPLRPRRR